MCMQLCSYVLMKNVFVENGWEILKRKRRVYYLSYVMVGSKVLYNYSPILRELLRRAISAVMALNVSTVFVFADIIANSFLRDKHCVTCYTCQD